MSTPSTNAIIRVRPPVASANNPSRPATTAERTADARQAFLAAVAETAAPLNAKFQAQYDIIHEQAIQIEGQRKQLEKNTQEVRKENDEMERWIGRATRKLEELKREGEGELDAEGLEEDLGELEDLLDLLEGEGGHDGDMGVDEGGVEATAVSQVGKGKGREG